MFVRTSKFDFRQWHRQQLYDFDDVLVVILGLLLKFILRILRQSILIIAIYNLRQSLTTRERRWIVT